MKNRRNVVIAILLIAVLCVGIGYALTSAEITFNGTIEYSPTFNLEWKDVTDDVSITSEVISADKTEVAVTFNATEWGVGEVKTFTATVHNPSLYAGENLRVQTDVVDPAHYNIEVSIPNTDIAAGGDQTVQISITLKSLPAVSTTLTENFSFTVVADQVA